MLSCSSASWSLKSLRMNENNNGGGYKRLSWLGWEQGKIELEYIPPSEGSYSILSCYLVFYNYILIFYLKKYFSVINLISTSCLMQSFQREVYRFFTYLGDFRVSVCAFRLKHFDIHHTAISAWGQQAFGFLIWISLGLSQPVMRHRVHACPILLAPNLLLALKISCCFLKILQLKL